MSVALRPFLATDAPRCAAIFRASIEEIASEDYSPAQCEAWAGRADDLEAFAGSLAAMLTLAAVDDGEVVGFASPKGPGHIEMIYVNPEFAQAGVGATLLGALETIARGRGATQLTAEVSDTAKPLFDRREFVAVERIVKRIDDEWLGATTMSKTLAPKRAEP